MYIIIFRFIIMILLGIPQYVFKLIRSISFFSYSAYSLSYTDSIHNLSKSCIKYVVLSSAEHMCNDALLKNIQILNFVIL